MGIVRGAKGVISPLLPRQNARIFAYFPRIKKLLIILLTFWTPGISLIYNDIFERLVFE